MKFAGKIALITGASKGIGKCIAIELAKQGASVIINYKSDHKGAEETLKLIKKNGGYGIVKKCDISSYSQCKLMFEEIISIFGRLDILVNNAGISKIGLFIDNTEEDYNRIMDTNFKSVFNCSNCAVQYMLDRKQGSIINISSIWGNVGASCEVLYSASKGAINTFTKALGKELAPSNIRVNAISPGIIKTQMNDYFSDEEKKDLEEEIPMMRFGEGEDIAKAVVYLASDDAKYITSQILTIDGGWL